MILTYRVETVDSDNDGRDRWMLERTYRVATLKPRPASGLTIDEALDVFRLFVRIGESARIVLESDAPSDRSIIATTDTSNDIGESDYVVDPERAAVLAVLEAKIKAGRSDESAEARALRYLVRGTR